MGLLTQDKPYDNVRFPSLQAYTLKDATNFFGGSFCAVNPSNSGRLEPFNGTAGQILLGRLYDADNGAGDSTGAALGRGDDALTIYTGSGGKPQGRCLIDAEVLPAVTIAGLASAADIGKPVFLNGDDQTLTLTPPSTKALAVGEVLDWSTGTTGDLLVYSYALRSVLQKAGGGQGGGLWLHLASVSAVATGALGVAASAFGILLPAPFHGKIVDCFAMNNGGALTGGPVTVTPSIVPNGGVNTPTTGGDMVLAQTLAAKTRTAGTAITGNNEFHVGDTLDLTSSAVTQFTAGGPVDFFVKLQPLSGV